MAILLDSVIAHGNKGFGNIYIYAAEHDVSNYNLTINNSLSSGANGYALMIVSVQDKYKQCPATQNTSLDFTIVIVITATSLTTKTALIVQLCQLLLLV